MSFYVQKNNRYPFMRLLPAEPDGLRRENRPHAGAAEHGSPDKTHRNAGGGDAADAVRRSDGHSCPRNADSHAGHRRENGAVRASLRAAAGMAFRISCTSSPVRSSGFSARCLTIAPAMRQA